MTVEELEIIIKANIKDAIKGIKEVTDAVRQCVADSVKPIQQISEKTKQVISSNSNSINNMKQQMKSYLNTSKSTTAQEELLIRKIREKYSLLQKLQNTQPVQLGNGKVATTNQKQLEVRAEIEKLESQLRKLQGTTETTTDKSKKGFENLWNSLKKGTLLLLGARSAFLLLRQGMQSALQADEALQAQQSITSNAIGQLFVPAMKVALDAVQYLVIGIALLIKMFTGYDALSKVTTKNIQSASKETKKFNEQLTSMDEITNLNGESTGLGISGGLQADLNALEDFNKKIEEVQKLFDSWGVQKLVDKLKDLWKWIVENKDQIILFGIEIAAIFGAAKIGTWLSNIGQLIGGNGKGVKGLAGSLDDAAGKALGLNGMLGGLVAAGVITVTVKLLIDGLKAFNNMISNIDKYGMKNGVQLSLIQNKMKNTNDSINGSLWDKFWATAKKMLPGNGFLFASGGVVDKPTRGILGEYSGASTNPEIISPQSVMYDTMVDAFNDILPAVQNNNNSGPAVFNIDGREFAKATYSYMEEEGKRLGGTMAIRRS